MFLTEVVNSNLLMVSFVGLISLIMILAAIGFANSHKKKVINNDTFMKGTILGRTDMIRREVVKVIDSNKGIDPKIIKCFKDAEQQMNDLTQDSDIATYKSVEEHMLTILTMFRCIVGNVNPNFDIDYKKDVDKKKTDDWLDMPEPKKTSVTLNIQNIKKHVPNIETERNFVDDGVGDENDDFMGGSVL